MTKLHQVVIKFPSADNVSNQILISGQRRDVSNAINEFKTKLEKFDIQKGNIPPPSLCGEYVGKGGSFVAHVRTTFHVSVTVSEPEVQATPVTVTGEPENVKKVVEIMKEWLVTLRSTKRVATHKIIFEN